MSRSRRARNQGADFSWELGALKTEAASVNGLFLGRPSTIAHHLDGLLGPIEIRPWVGAALAAGPADKSIFNIGQPGIIRPAIAAHRD